MPKKAKNTVPEATAFDHVEVINGILKRHNIPFIAPPKGLSLSFVNNKSVLLHSDTVLKEDEVIDLIGNLLTILSKMRRWGKNS